MEGDAQLATALSTRYLLDREIGRGGMATVYLARDLRHGREVAIKVLHSDLRGIVGAERFLAEIRVTAGLQHPNLVPLFDSGEAGGLPFYVMPYIAGETLRARLVRERQLPIEECVQILTAVASAVDYAHRHGVIHRDLKPENILLHERQAVVADFGISLALVNASGHRITQTGVSVGTPHYMSPEQATGDRAVDGRTDVYALGAMLYEMLTGEPPHTGATAQAILARVITERARPVRQVRDTVPPHIEAAIDRALCKLAADRFATAQEFADAVAKPLPQAHEAITAESPVPVRRSGFAQLARWWPTILPWTVIAAGVLALSLGRPEHPPLPSARFVVTFPPESRLLTSVGSFLEIAPTGDGFAYLGQSPRGPMVFYRRLSEESPRAIAGTENGAQPFFSPAGDWLGFIGDGMIKKVPLSGGAPQVVARLGNISPTGFAWGTDDRIVFGRVGGGLLQVPASGGEPAPFTTLAPGETSHRGVNFLRDQRTAVFTINADESRIAFVDRNGRVTRTDRLAVKARQIAPDLIAYSTRDGTILAAGFDARTLSIGPGMALESNVFVRYGGFSAWSASPNGSAIFLRGEAVTRLMKVSRDGAAQALSPERRSFGRPRFSPDGSRIALQIGAGSSAQSDIWVFDRASKTLSRLTFGGGNSDPLWTPDGKRIVFSGPFEPANPEVDLYWQSADGSGRAERLLATPGREWAYGWGPDGRTLVIEQLRGGSMLRVGAFRIGDTTVTDVTPAPPTAMTRLPSMSPDGRYVAYSSNESGRMEVYVTTFPGTGAKWLVSSDGGDQPLWSHGGHELFYQTASGVMAVRIATTPTFAVMERTPLFEGEFVRSFYSSWDVFPDDKAFLMLHAADDAGQLVVQTNWGDVVRERLGAAKRR